jgi:hypothetical protein
VFVSRRFADVFSSRGFVNGHVAISSKGHKELPVW